MQWGPDVFGWWSESSNFEYLAPHDTHLFIFGLHAELYVYQDSNTSMVKSRQFGERMVKLLWLEFDMEGNASTYHGRASQLYARGVIPGFIHDLLAKIRVIGNEAVHEGSTSKADALLLVRACYDIGVWFHRVIMNGSEPPSFVVPTLQDSIWTSGADPGVIQEQLDEMWQGLEDVWLTLNSQSAGSDEQETQSSRAMIADGDVLYKPVHPLHWVRCEGANNAHRLSSAFMMFEKDVSGLSAYSRSLLANFGLSWKNIVPDSKYGVVSLSVADLRSIGIDVITDTLDDSPAMASHVLITAPNNISSRRQARDLSIDLGKMATMVRVPRTSM